MEVLDGDIERLGWELRTVDAAPERIGGVLLPQAVDFMRDANAFAQEIQFHGGTWPKSLSFEVTSNWDTGFLRAGWLANMEIDRAGMTQMLGLAKMPKLKYPKGFIKGFNQFSQKANEIFGPLQIDIDADDIAQAWRAVRNLSQPLGMQKWCEDREGGHCDMVVSDSHVSSIQLSEKPSLWVLRYIDRNSKQVQSKRIRQEQGQEVLLKSTPSQLPLLKSNPGDTQAVTPYHHIINQDDTASRFSYIRYLLAYKNNQRNYPSHRRWYSRIPGFRGARK